MKIEVDKEILLKSITIADSIITSRHVNTILSNCLFNISNDEIEIISTDNEIGIKTRLDAICDTKMSFTVLGKKFASILRELPKSGKVVQIDVNDNFVLDIKTKTGDLKGHYSLIGASNADFPEIPTYGDEDIVEIEQPLFKEMIRRVIFAAATDTIKPVFNGVYFLSETTGAVTAVATDSRRLSLTTVQMNNEINIKNGVIVPLKAVNEIYRLLKSDGICKIFIGKNQCFFKIDDTEIVTRIIDGQFPNYKHVIPKENRVNAIVNKEQLLESLRRAMIFTREPANKILLNFSKNNLRLEARTPDLGESEEDLNIAADFSDEIGIGLNAQFLIEAVREIDSESVVLGITGVMSPVTITPEDDETYISVIMPIQIKSTSGE